MTEAQDGRGGTSDLAQWADVEAIKKLKAEYFWNVDNKLWAEWGEVFTDDVEWYSGGKRISKSRDELVGWVKKALERFSTVHQGHMPVIQITSPTTATGRWLLYDLIISTDGRKREGYGYYLEEYLKGKDGHWRIKSCKLDYFWQGGDLVEAMSRPRPERLSRIQQESQGPIS